MTREEAKTMLPIIQAFAEGREIEFRSKGFGEEWKKVNEIPGLSYSSFDYRIKPEPNYRPFKNAEECWQEMLKHQPFGWVKYQCDFFQIIHVDDNLIGYGSACGTILHSKFEDIFKDSTFADGAPFGVKEGVWEN